MCIKDFTDSLVTNILNLRPSFSIRPYQPHQLVGQDHFKLQGQSEFEYQLIHSPQLTHHLPSYQYALRTQQPDKGPELLRKTQGPILSP